MSKKSLLIIDDDFDVKDSMQTMFNLRDFDSSLACSGQEGVSEFQKKKFDAVLLDIRMPEMDGYETFEKIINMDSSANVFFVTGISTDDEKLKRCQELGLKGVFVKPLNFSKMVTTLEAL